jgi:hypothetical protein
VGAVEGVNAVSLVSGARTGCAHRAAADKVTESPAPSVFLARRRQQAWTITGKEQRNSDVRIARLCGRCPPFVRRLHKKCATGRASATGGSLCRIHNVKEPRRSVRALYTGAHASPNEPLEDRCRCCRLFHKRLNRAWNFGDASPVCFRSRNRSGSSSRRLERANPGFNTMTGNGGETLWVPLKM